MILAAGAGTRLHPLTVEVPKPMLPVNGTPTIEWIVRWLCHYEVRKIAINLFHRPLPVVAHLGNGSAFGASIAYSIEERILGTAGGVKRIENYFDEPMVLVYGDVLTDFDLNTLVEFHLSKGTEPHASLSLYHAPNPSECGIVGIDAEGRVQRFVEKPPPNEVFSDLANAGVLVIDPPLLASIPQETFYDFSHDLFPDLLSQGVPLYGMAMPADTYLIDIGTHEKYDRVQHEWPTRAVHF